LNVPSFYGKWQVSTASNLRARRDDSVDGQKPEKLRPKRRRMRVLTRLAVQNWDKPSLQISPRPDFGAGINWSTKATGQKPVQKGSDSVTSSNRALVLGAATVASMTATGVPLVWIHEAWPVGLLGLIASVVLGMRLAALLTLRHLVSRHRMQQLAVDAAKEQQLKDARERRRKISAIDAEDILGMRAASR
jgi:hypothetical protein